MKVGIDCMAFDVPKIHLPIEVLALKRNIEPEKLMKGLGLKRMTIPDAHQDVVCFAANALVKLIEQNEIDLSEISRIYVGTESGMDASKPIASYLVSLMEDKYGVGVLENCDAVDFTFACIGAVDALHNCLDFVRLYPEKKAIVIATDIAKYDLESTGEYTQGAGAIAMLIKANPGLLSFNDKVGVSTKGVFDFFKPKRTVEKSKITGNSKNEAWMGVLETEVLIHKDQPVFDGQYSNKCYVDRTSQAYNHLKKEVDYKGILFDEWTNILMHLPYAYQGRRTFVEIYAQEYVPIATIGDVVEKEDVKLLAKSEEYKSFVEAKIAPSEMASSMVGNVYTGSVFLGMLSTLYFHYTHSNNIEESKMGIIAYGSGSKSKVFEVRVESNWKQVTAQLHLFEELAGSSAIDFDVYEQLHKKELKESIVEPQNEFILDYVEKDVTELMGARYYKWV